MSAKDALFRFYSKRARVKKPRGKKNASPENDFKKIAKTWLEKNGFSVNVIESKAVWSESAGRYLRGNADVGFSDLVGVTPYLGVAFFIELKAPGRRSSIKLHQIEFLKSKINNHAFACCTDSIEHLEKCFRTWVNFKNSNQHQDAINFLLNDLPKKEGKQVSLDKSDTIFL